MNYSDTLSTSPHYLYRKYLGTINESAKFDIMFKESRIFVTRIFEPLHELLWYYHSNETSSAKFPHEIWFIKLNLTVMLFYSCDYKYQWNNK